MNKIKLSTSNKILLIINVIVILFSSSISVYAVNNAPNASSVSYDNSISGINSTNVQSAIDELDGKANNYDSIASRLSTLENGYTKKSIELKSASTAGNGGYIDFHYNNSSSYTSRIIESESGKFNILSSNGLLINGKESSSISSGFCSINTTNSKTTTNSDCKWFKYGRIVIMYVDEICPKAAANGVSVVAATGLPAPAYSLIGKTSTYGISQSPSYRIAVKSDGNLYWHFSVGSDSCPVSTGEYVYISAN